MNTSDLHISNDEAKHLEDLIEGLGEGSSPSIHPPQGASSKNEDSEYRLKSPLKMRYSAEVELLRKRWGSLEDIRGHLGLSQRKISQLLMVDPSAWTRWTKYDHEAPPHIYRALSWFLLLQEKDPSLNPYGFLQSVARPSLPKAEIQSISEDIHQSLKKQLMSESHSELQKNQRHMKWLLVANATLLALTVLVFASFRIF